MECKRVSPASFTPGADDSCSTPKPILTRSKELIAHLAGRPKDPSFVGSLQSLEGQMELSQPLVSAERWAKRAKDGRGNHPSVSVGLSHGGGSKVCASSEGLSQTHSFHSAQECSRYLQRKPLRRWTSSSSTQQWIDL